MCSINQFLLLRVNSVRIRSVFGSHFSAFGLNTEIFRVNLCIQSRCGKMRARKTPNTDIFHVVLKFQKIPKEISAIKFVFSLSPHEEFVFSLGPHERFQGLQKEEHQGGERQYYPFTQKSAMNKLETLKFSTKVSFSK